MESLLVARVAMSAGERYVLDYVSLIGHEHNMAILFFSVLVCIDVDRRGQGSLKSILRDQQNTKEPLYMIVNSEFLETMVTEGHGRRISVLCSARARQGDRTGSAELDSEVP